MGFTDLPRPALEQLLSQFGQSVGGAGREQVLEAPHEAAVIRQVAFLAPLVRPGRFGGHGLQLMPGLADQPGRRAPGEIDGLLQPRQFLRVALKNVDEQIG